MAGEVTGHAGGVASPSLGHLRAAQAWWSFIAVVASVCDNAVVRWSTLVPHSLLSQPHTPPHPCPARSCPPHDGHPVNKSCPSIFPFSLTKHPSLAVPGHSHPVVCHYCGDVSETCSNSGCNYCLRTVVSASLSHNQLFTCHVTGPEFKNQWQTLQLLILISIRQEYLSPV